MQQLLAWKGTESHKLTHRFLFEEPSAQNIPPYADNNFILPQLTELQQRIQLWIVWSE